MAGGSRVVRTVLSLRFVVLVGGAVRTNFCCRARCMPPCDWSVAWQLRQANVYR